MKHANWKPETGPEEMLLSTEVLNSIVRELLWKIQTDAEVAEIHKNCPMFHKAYKLLENACVNYEPMTTRNLAGVIIAMGAVLNEHTLKARELLAIYFDEQRD
jgi:hypothetical protein